MSKAGQGSISAVTALLLILAIPGLPISRLENEFAGIGHLVGYEVIWWTLIFALLIYVRKIEARPLSSIGFRRLSLWDALFGLGSGLFVLAGMAGIYYGLFPFLHLSESQKVGEIA